jgi:hypothetical protein
MLPLGGNQYMYPKTPFVAVVNGKDPFRANNWYQELYSFPPPPSSTPAQTLAGAGPPGGDVPYRRPYLAGGGFPRPTCAWIQCERAQGATESRAAAED